MSDHHDEPLRDNLLTRLAGDQRVLFVIVGGINTGLSFAYFVALQMTLGQVTNYMVVLLANHVVSVLTAFTMHRRLVFKVHGHLWKDLGRFELVNLGALGANAVLLPFGVEILGLPVIVSQLMSTVVTVLASFFLHRGFSFRRPTEPVTPLPDHHEHPGAAA
ncbi:GtrA family protein [Solicola sp. PLA-1-18]|uniref:GtrA family protein n=1 Tax=Solicola sp. PLA-1-18 TaxID=3380532 RepID=UPI003B76AF2E